MKTEINPWYLLVLFSVLAYSISNHFVFAHGPFHIYDKIRNIADRIGTGFGELFHCMICFPFWVGLVLSLCDYFFLYGTPLTPFNILQFYTNMHWAAVAFLDGMLASGIVWLIHTLQEFFERIYNFESEDE